MGEEDLEHKCGFTFLALRKPLEYYPPNFIRNKQFKMLFKSRNRGQGAAGLVTVNPYVPRELEYMFIDKEIGEGTSENLVEKLFCNLRHDHHGIVSIGHVRYPTHGSNTLHYAHPIERQHDRPTKRFAIVENGNHTNTSEQQQEVLSKGFRLTSDSDMQTIKTTIAFVLNREHELLKERELSNDEISNTIDWVDIISKASASWEGGYVLAGVLGNGDSFVAVDPCNIRPCSYYVDDDIIVAASETRAITSAFSHIKPRQVENLGGGKILRVRRDGSFDDTKNFTEQRDPANCHFEPQYFARPDSYVFGMSVYDYRTNGIAENLAQRIYEQIGEFDKDFVIVPVPNTSTPIAKEVSKYLSELVGFDIPFEIGINKDEAARGFISDEESRRDFIDLAYDPVHYVLEGKKVIVIDDSIVRGTTSKEKIVPSIAEGGASEIYLVSADAPVKYPCCYGIDMSEMKKFIYFEAMINLIADNDYDRELADAYHHAKAQRKSTRPDNVLHGLYSLFTEEELCNQIAEMIRPEGFDGKLRVLYNTPENIQEAGRKCHHTTPLLTCCLDGDHPYDGGMRIINNAFLNFMDGIDDRAY